jgi:hypothetical protein
MPIFCQIGHTLYGLWLSFLRVILPTRFKRFIILTTIFKKGYDEKIFDNLNFRNLNNRLHIANNVKAMENISMVSTRLWSEVELKDLLQQSVHCNLDGECVSIRDADGIGEKIFSRTPVWLRYDKQTLVQDITSLFTSEKVHLVAAT